VIRTNDPCTVNRTRPMRGRVSGPPVHRMLCGFREESWSGRGAVLALALVLLLPACHGGGSSPPSHSPTVPASPDSASDIARRDALAAYQAMWADMAAAARTADYKSPLLPQHAAKAALSLLVRGLYTDKRLGIVVKGHPVTHARVVSVSPSSNPTTAQIVDCFDDTHWLNYKVTGGLQNNVPGGLHHTTATVTEIDGAWKVIELHVEASGTCKEPSSSPSPSA
jgi:hypothetical protein